MTETVVMTFNRNYRGHLSREAHFMAGMVVAVPKFLAEGLELAGAASATPDADPALVAPFDRTADTLTAEDLRRVELLSQRAQLTAEIQAIDLELEEGVSNA